MGKTNVAKKRNPNDATFRNIRALARRVADLESKVSEFGIWRTFIDNRIKRTMSDADLARAILSEPAPSYRKHVTPTFKKASKKR